MFTKKEKNNTNKCQFKTSLHKISHTHIQLVWWYVKSNLTVLLEVDNVLLEVCGRVFSLEQSQNLEAYQGGEAGKPSVTAKNTNTIKQFSFLTTIYIISSRSADAFIHFQNWKKGKSTCRKQFKLWGNLVNMFVFYLQHGRRWSRRREMVTVWSQLRARGPFSILRRPPVLRWRVSTCISTCSHGSHHSHSFTCYNYPKKFNKVNLPSLNVLSFTATVQICTFFLLCNPSELWAIILPCFYYSRLVFFRSVLSVTIGLAFVILSFNI